MAEVFQQNAGNAEKVELSKVAQNYPTSRFINFYSRNTQQLRQDYDKKRFPPTKKQAVLKKQSCKNRNNQQRQTEALNTLQNKNDTKGIQTIKINVAAEGFNSLEKGSASNINNTNIYHAVGQSQRQKLMGVSPVHHQFIYQINEGNKESQI